MKRVRASSPLRVDPIRRAAEWSGWPLTDHQHTVLKDFEGWLREEAIPRGGLGPNEGSRLEIRHLADSLVFSAAWRAVSPPARVADLGAGVGLPGIPLAILWPTVFLHLVDRGGRRADLARRAVRLLGLDNVEVRQADAATVRLSAEMVVARAAAPPESVVEWARRIVVPGGVVVIGGSWREPPTSVAGEDLLEVPATVLDRPVWLRIMAAS